MRIVTENAQETRDFGKKFANRLRGGETLALSGDLGSGKTTFVQGVAEGLGIKARIVSPTFILMREYPASNFNVFHLDLYRLEDGIKNSVKELGIEDLWDKKGNLVIIEWANKIKDLIPKHAIWIKFKSTGEKRILDIERI